MKFKYVFLCFVSILFFYLFVDVVTAQCNFCSMYTCPVEYVDGNPLTTPGTEQNIGDCDGLCPQCRNEYVCEGNNIMRYWTKYCLIPQPPPLSPREIPYQCKGLVKTCDYCANGKCYYSCGRTCAKDLTARPFEALWPCSDLNRLYCDMYCSEPTCTGTCICKSDTLACCPSGQVCQGGNCVATPSCTVTAWGCTDSIASYPARCDLNKIITYQCIAGYCQPVETICPPPDAACPLGYTCNPATLNCYCPVPPDCSDSDGGAVYGVGGSCKDKGACAAGCKDSCSGSTLTEWYCDGSTCKSTAYSCPTGKCYTYDGKGYCSGEIMNCKYNICTDTLEACGANCIRKCTDTGCNPVLYPSVGYDCPNYGECYPGTSWMCCAGNCLGCPSGTSTCCSVSGSNPHCCKATEICLDSGNCDEVCNNLAYSRFADPYCSKCEHCKDGLLNCGENPTSAKIPQGCPNAGSLQRDCGTDCKSAGTTETSPGYNYIYVIEQLLSPPFPNYQVSNIKLAFTSENFCQDCLDNDNDCLTDCQDPDCENLPICVEPFIYIIPEEVSAAAGEIIDFQVIITNKLPKAHNITINKPELYNFSSMLRKPEWDSLIISYTNSTG